MMRPEEIAVAILRRSWIIVLAAVVAALVAFVGTGGETKTYTVNARLMAIADPPDYWVDLYAKNRLASYRDIISSWAFISAAMENADSDISPDVAASGLSVSHNPDANVVQITVNDTDPQRAADIANALADEFVRRSVEMNDALLARPRVENQTRPETVTIVKLDTPSAPSTPNASRRGVSTAAGGLAGALAGACIVFLLVYRDDTLKNRTDLERHLGLPLLATVREDRRQ